MSPVDSHLGARSVERSSQHSGSQGGSGRVLIISSDSSRRRMLAGALLEEHEVLTAEDEDVGLPLLANEAVDVILVETRNNFRDIQQGLVAIRPGVEVVILAKDAFELGTQDLSGVFHVIPPGMATPEQVRWIVGRAWEKKRLIERLRHLERRIADQNPAIEIVAASRVMDRVFELAHVASVLSSPVLLVGESGTGKEMLARAMHQQGRAAGPFVTFDCGALTPDRIERELFGSGDGSSTVRPLVLAADGGTLFLADIATLPHPAQARLVQLIQHGEIRCDQDREVRSANVRLIAATCEEIKPVVDAGVMRMDLYVHLNAMLIRLPPLRRRKEDIPLLAQHFLRLQSRGTGTTAHRISQEALRELRGHRWSGNVRELKHAIARALASARGDGLVPGDFAFLREEQGASVVLAPSAPSRHTAFDPALFELPFAQAKKQAVMAFEQAYIRDALRRTGDNVSEAARQSGLDRSNFRRMAKKIGGD